MNKFLYILFLLLFVASCSSLNTPEKPKLTALVSVNGYAQTDSYIYVYDISQAQVTWDVSYIPDAYGVEFVISRNKDCDSPIATARSPYTNSATRVALMGYKTGSYNPIENLAFIFADNISEIRAGTFYLCIRSVSYSGSVSGLSYPVTIDIIY